MSNTNIPRAPAASGFLQSDGFGDLLQAAGMSLMSSPSNAPLSGLGQYLPAIQKTTMARREKEEIKEKEHKTLTYLREHDPEAAAMAESTGDFAGAFNYSLKKRQQAASGPEMTADMRNFNFAQSNPEFAKMMGYGQPKQQELPGSVREYEYAKGQGYEGSYQDWSTESRKAGATVINTGNGASGVQLPAEMGARIGMGDQFLEELPTIEKQINGGVVDSYTGRAQLALGAGPAADVWRRIETGRDALVRNLTGAGMSESEARNQTARYQITPTDSKETMLKKLKGLQSDLIATRQGAIGARTGGIPAEPPTGLAPAADISTMSDAELEALANGG